MDAPVWLVIVIAVVLGGIAALIAQVTTARKTLEAAAKARILREDVEALDNKKNHWEGDLHGREKKLDELMQLDIQHKKGKLDDAALKSFIAETRGRMKELKNAVQESEKIIDKYRRALADLETQKALKPLWYAAISVFVGGATAGIFGFIGLLGAEDSPSSFNADVRVTAYLVVQSMLFGGGWPLLWEKLLASDRLEDVANKAVGSLEEEIQGLRLV